MHFRWNSVFYFNARDLKHALHVKKKSCVDKEKEQLVINK